MKKLNIVFKPCGGGPCPTFYQSDDGRVFIQGYKTSTDVKLAAGENLPEGEDIVEIDQEFLAGLKAL